MEPKKIFMSVAGIIAMILIVIFFLWYIKSRKILDKPGASTIFLVLAVLALLVIIALLIAWFLLNNGSKDKGMHVYYKKLNEQLMMMDNGNEFTWKKGDLTRIDTRTFDDGKDYFAIVGPTKLSGRQHAIFSITDEVIVKFTGDLSPEIEKDLFAGFKPKHKDKWMAWQEYNKMNDLKNKNKAPILVNPENPSEQQVKSEVNNESSTSTGKS